MDLSNVVNVTVFLQAVGAIQQGFGVPMILGATPRFNEVVRSYTSLAGMATDGFLATDPEYLAAAALLAQTPKVPEFRVGRRAAPPTLKVNVVPAAINSAIYKLWLDGQAVSFTSDAGALVAEITAGLKIAIDALSPSAWANTHGYVVGDRVKNDTGKKYRCTTAGTSAGSGGPTGYSGAITDSGCVWTYIGVQPTATDNGTSLDVVAPAAGEWFSLSIDDIPPTVGLAGLAVEQTNIDGGIAADLAAIAVADATWYAFSSVFSGTAEVKLASYWAASNSRLYLQATQESACATHVLSGATDIMAFVKGRADSHTAILFRQNPAEFTDFGWLGRRLPTQPGTEDWMFQTVSGSTPDNLTQTQINNINAKWGNWYTVVGAAGNTGKGRCASGQYLDTVRFVDAFSNDLQTSGFNYLKANADAGKTPLDDAGIAGLGAVMRLRGKFYETLHAPGNDTAVALVPGSTVVTLPKAADLTTSDKSERVLNGMQLACQYAGAVHKVNLSVSITL
jgi:hypothetical protein